MIKKLKKEYNDILDMLTLEKAMYEGAEQRDYSWKRFLFESAIIELQQRFAERKCRKGHLYDRETGNPESGSYSIECTRCGHSVSGYW